jgi:hypothetical protein
MTGRIEPAERLVSMPAIAQIEFLPDADGRMVIFSHEGPDADLTARLLRPGESFLGLSFEQLVAAGTGRIIPDGQGGGRIEARSVGSRRSDRQRRWGDWQPCPASAAGRVYRLPCRSSWPMTDRRAMARLTSCLGCRPAGSRWDAECQCRRGEGELVLLASVVCQPPFACKASPKVVTTRLGSTHQGGVPHDHAW